MDRKGHSHQLCSFMAAACVTLLQKQSLGGRKGELNSPGTVLTPRHCLLPALKIGRAALAACAWAIGRPNSGLRLNFADCISISPV